MRSHPTEHLIRAVALYPKRARFVDWLCVLGGSCVCMYVSRYVCGAGACELFSCWVLGSRACSSADLRNISPVRTSITWWELVITAAIVKKMFELVRGEGKYND